MSDKFQKAVVELLGPAALAGNKMSHYEVALMFWNAALESLQSENAALKRQLEEAGKDAERLDYFMSCGAVMVRDGDEFYLYKHTSSRCSISAPTPRAAIDAAIKGEKE